MMDVASVTATRVSANGHKSAKVMRLAMEKLRR